MGLIAIIYAIELIITAIVMYGIYKLIWYAIKMLIFKGIMRKMSCNAAVERKRKFSEIFFGKKGPADYVITVDGKKYEISVLSFVSTHGRWNIEKTRNGYAIESRRASKVFFGKHVNSNQPDHVAEYKGESRVSRKELLLTPVDESFEKQILLLYPYPARITYTDAHYNELRPGDTVEGHVIMNIAGIKELIRKKEN